MLISCDHYCAACSFLQKYIANRLLEINERGSWQQDLDKLDEEAKAKQDEEIFQIARLVNCGWFGSGMQLLLLHGDATSCRSQPFSRTTSTASSV